MTGRLTFSLLWSAFFSLHAKTPLISYEVVRSYAHDPRAFCQGLVYDSGHFFESTGLYGKSSIRKTEIATGKVLQVVPLSKNLFGEGLTLLNGKLYQLTWQSKIGFVWDPQTLALQKSFSYPTEGWGLTHDGRHLIMSDGTSSLYFLDPENFQRIRELTVMHGTRKIRNLNELEFIQGKIFANIWQSDSIAMISPETGNVEAWIDFSAISKKFARFGADVLNGIAHDPESGHLYITGKNWPTVFEIRLKSEFSETSPH